MVSSIGRHARSSPRAREGLIAGALGVSVLLIALTTVGLGMSAQASSESFHLYSQINNTALQAPVDNGNKNVTMTVTPTTAAPGDSIEVKVTSTDLAFVTGPA